ncbi:flagellar biosynthesis protein FlhB [Solimonas marina]|uniref:Flagellar biosynthetic protein FlhB n=1 Tax=Solimonas marina TaxID=2714601 RepID=A0A969W825_9GAMM|nr:flagellar biosynthesis protein FlhB [Solimonas marina]NKF21703.1 flagellar biosynthesis protein FlhB [Solimonas marina]
MSDQQQRTEQATPKRLREARERGELPRSRELTTAIVVGAGVLVMMAAGSGIAERATAWFRQALQPDPAMLGDPSRMLPWFGQLVMAGFMVAAPLLAAGLVAAIVGPLALGGWNFSTKAVRFDPKRINPLSGLGRMFSANALVELAKGVGKSALLGALGAAFLWSRRDEFLALSRMDVGPALASGVGLCMSALGWLMGGLIVIAAIDAPYQWFSHAKRLRMTRQEVRDEFKQTEGSPEVKGRLRRLQAERSRKRMIAAVPEADVVIVNPTHYAVALKYDAQKMRAPRVVAKGVDEVALAIREAAKGARVPLVEAPPLARALYRGASVDQEVPVALYAAVAQVLTYVYQLRQYAATSAGTRTAPPAQPRIDDVPNGEPDE